MRSPSKEEGEKEGKGKKKKKKRKRARLTIKEVSKLLKSATSATARNVRKACEGRKKDGVSEVSSESSD